jgi:hypothetical protein
MKPFHVWPCYPPQRIAEETPILIGRCRGCGSGSSSAPTSSLQRGSIADVSTGYLENCLQWPLFLLPEQSLNGFHLNNLIVSSKSNFHLKMSGPIGEAPCSEHVNLQISVP